MLLHSCYILVMFKLSVNICVLLKMKFLHDIFKIYVERIFKYHNLALVRIYSLRLKLIHSTPEIKRNINRHTHYYFTLSHGIKYPCYLSGYWYLVPLFFRIIIESNVLSELILMILIYMG